MIHLFLQMFEKILLHLLTHDDTAPGIAEGVAAGCPTVGVALCGNHVGLTEEELSALPEDEVEEGEGEGRHAEAA